MLKDGFFLTTDGSLLFDLCIHEDLIWRHHFRVCLLQNLTLIFLFGYGPDLTQFQVFCIACLLFVGQDFTQLKLLHLLVHCEFDALAWFVDADALEIDLSTEVTMLQRHVKIFRWLLMGHRLEEVFIFLLVLNDVALAEPIGVPLVPSCSRLEEGIFV